MEYTCHYCDLGRVDHLPMKCPLCGAALTKLVNEMTPDELREAEKRNVFSKVTLAS